MMGGIISEWWAASARNPQARGWKPDGGVVSAVRNSQQTFCRWKAKYSGMSVSGAQKLKTLEGKRGFSPTLRGAAFG